MAVIRPIRAILAVLSLTLLLAACQTDLYTGLSEREANEIVAALTGVGIPAKKAPGGEGMTVTVDEARFAEAMALLDARGLPAARYDSMGDVFQKQGLVSSPVEERARMVYALSQELSRTISEIDNVLSARIHVVLPESDVLGRDVKPSSASVFVRYAAGSNVEAFTSQIKLLVANSIEGLLYDNITLVMVPVEAEAQGAGAAPQLKNVLGLWVHPASERRLWMTLGGMALIAGAAAGAAALPHLLKLRRKADVSGDLA